MDFLLFDPGFVLGNVTGFLAGGVAAGGLIHYGAQATERKLRAEADLIRARVAASQASDGWARASASAANDEGSGTRRGQAQLRGGPR